MKIAKEELYARLHISPRSKDRYMLTKTFVYKDITIPVGFITNGANIPRIFWSLIPPNKSDIMPAVAIHDYLTDLKDYRLADDMFEECLKDLEVNKIVRIVIISSVRSYHKLRYNV